MKRNPYRWQKRGSLSRWLILLLVLVALLLTRPTEQTTPNSAAKNDPLQLRLDPL